ncbi:MAG TPA: ATP-dependent DNA helicase RecG [Anaerolineaceae bacterium]|nr:ATP-dependent DNA helicase RecG [Anaerolineaceae bacterium]
MDQIITNLPYNLTNAQKNCINELTNDLNSGLPMSRLIQGDVGSGKTVVAAIIIAGVIKSGFQTAVMAPTGILADQLFMNIKSFLLSNAIISDNEICYLSGTTSEKNREIIKTGLLNGTIKVIIGTHAILEDPIQFKNLELVVIDEQHRFGVMQRKKIRAKGKSSHLLVMSATPIPRSLALTIYGDLDLSIIDEIPPGRKEVKTRIINPSNRMDTYTFIQNQINDGNQAFIVYPLVEIDDTEFEESRAAVNEYSRLKSEVFQGANIGLLHGRMKGEDKEKMMDDFRNNKYQILISTTVIEVGVDIPNATVMLIEGANRFGLSQLHQLRGRVGRGQEQSYCILIPENEDAIENERLKAMVATNDGFKLAEIDLQQRGPGDFIGTRQSGFKEIRFSTIMNGKLIDKARKFAKDVLDNDPNLINVESHFYKLLISEYWKKLMGVKN